MRLSIYRLLRFMKDSQRDLPLILLTREPFATHAFNVRDSLENIEKTDRFLEKINEEKGIGLRYVFVCVSRERKKDVGIGRGGRD